MPIYEYNCSTCGISQEVLVPVSKVTQSVSCSCGQPAIRAISIPARVWAPTRKGQ